MFLPYDFCLILSWEDSLENYYCVVLVAQLVKNPSAMRRPGFDTWARKIPWRRERLPTPVFWLGESHGLYTIWVAISQT